MESKSIGYYNVIATRTKKVGEFENVSQVPSFIVLAASPMEAMIKARSILSSHKDTETHISVAKNESLG